eukprot:7109660-Lingulodinium_polyedra.AAC.1
MGCPWVVNVQYWPWIGRGQCVRSPWAVDGLSKSMDCPCTVHGVHGQRVVNPWTVHALSVGSPWAVQILSMDIA